MAAQGAEEALCPARKGEEWLTSQFEQGCSQGSAQPGQRTLLGPTFPEAHPRSLLGPWLDWEEELRNHSSCLLLVSTDAASEEAVMMADSGLACGFGTGVSTGSSGSWAARARGQAQVLLGQFLLDWSKSSGFFPIRWL